MIDEGLLYPLSVHQTKHVHAHTGASVWYVERNNNLNTQLTTTYEGNSISFGIEKDGLLVFENNDFRVSNGVLVYRKVNTDIFSKILAFLDVSINKKNTYEHSSLITYLKLEDTSFLTEKIKGEKWFICAMLNNEIKIKSLCDIIRKTECYALVRFLLDNATANLSLYDLGKIYGLSYSHFRRLCKNALGSKVKNELCSWRMARCVLEMMEGRADLTTIAHKYGYSSSSHFSAEVKKKMGRSPRELCKRIEK